MKLKKTLKKKVCSKRPENCHEDMLVSMKFKIFIYIGSVCRIATKNGLMESASSYS